MELSKYMLMNTDLFPMDFLGIVVLHRSLHLIYGFASLIDSRNLVAAAPFLRLQVDSAIRFAAAWLVEQPHAFAMKILEGTPVRKMKAQTGELMTDRYLAGC